MFRLTVHSAEVKNAECLELKDHFSVIKADVDSKVEKMVDYLDDLRFSKAAKDDLDTFKLSYIERLDVI